MTLKQIGHYTLKAELAPWPDGIKARKGNHFTTSWRTIQIAPEAVGLINSSLILNLNDPCVLETTDWIRPLKYVGVWWGMHLGVETWKMDERHGATTAKEKGVEIMGHHETGGNIPNYERQMDHAMQWYTDHGIHLLKTGYAGAFPDGYLHHSQYGVNHYQRVVETAARHQMTLDAHEPIKDTGIRRTWPNMMTREGARGMEWNAWSEGNPPSHHVMLPFTRLLSGPMDYTPGTFDILFLKTKDSPRRQKWNDQDKGNSRVNTTLAKQLANWVILYSPLQMASDMIEHYEGHPAFQFFRDFDPDCDESKALAGEPGEFIAVVRKAKGNYFLGAATNESPRTLEVKLDFLEPGKQYKAVIYADGEKADWKTNPTDYKITEQIVTSENTLSIRMAPGGGQAVSFIKSNR